MRYDRYGGPEVLEVREVEDPVAAADGVLVRVRAAGLNPGEIAIREGRLHDRWPATFPSGQGTDFAGVVAAVGDGDGAGRWAVGDEVLGWTEERASQAELVAVPAAQVTAKPAALPWEVAGALFVVSMAAFASVDAVGVAAGETVVVAGASGGVGSYAAQLARRAGATVIGLASARSHDWLRSVGVVAVTYGEGAAERIAAAAPGGVDALLDTSGHGSVDLALALGVAPARINTIIDFEAAGRAGASTQGSHQVGTAARLGEQAALVAAGDITVPIAATFPLDQVQAAYEQLAAGRSRGKLVLQVEAQRS